MLKYASYTVSFQEVPDEVSLIFQISNCPLKCKGCHSPELQRDEGDSLTEDFEKIFNEYKDRITCVCFMGDGGELPELIKFSNHIKQTYTIKTAIYTGSNGIQASKDKLLCWPFASRSLYVTKEDVNYIKFGPYLQHIGGLDSETTNQRMFKWSNVNNTWIDVTDRFRINAE